MKKFQIFDLSQQNNVFVHISQASDPNRWMHGYNSGHLNGIEDLYMSDITTNDPPTPNMPAAGVLTVLGFLVTPRFTCTLGTGEDAAASVSYQFQQNGATLQFLPITSNVQASGKLYIMPNQFTSPNVQLIINDQNVKMLDTSVKQSIDISITSKVEFNA